MNKTYPLVSICCITYNHEKYIRDAIEGFLMQKTSFTFEIIIHDDASTDSTAKIVEEYANEHPELIIPIYQTVNQYSQGIKPWPNFVFPIARGKYIALCEGDDYWTDPLKLQKQVDFLEENEEYSLCFHNATAVNEEDKTLNNPFREIEAREYTGDEILKEWTIPTASVVFRKEANKQVHHPDFLFGDIILFLSLAENGKIWGMKENMSVYRRHEGGMTASNKSSINRTKKFIKHHQAIKASFGGKYEITENTILSKNYISLSKQQLKGFNLLFLTSLFKSYKLKPDSFIKNFLKSFSKTKQV